MPCFHGLAVSIHTPDGALPEYGVQKQSRSHRITSYIPVPPAKVPSGSTTNKAEQSTFSISITLLTPGLNVPYSTPKPTPEDPFPRPRVAGGLPGTTGERGRYGPAIGPYVPLTSSINETIAAYIYFDGRSKEEVATLLRRGEETWVNSRWVSVPDSEGGGLAEREFLFREVGLERWLNGLHLDGKDDAATIERPRQKLDKRRRKMRESCMAKMESDSDDDAGKSGDTNHVEGNRLLRYGDDEKAPLMSLSADEDEGSSTSNSDVEDEPPVPEAAGQIKVALFRVLASGEIKRGEYSPQFNAHDDDDDDAGGRGTQNGNGNGGEANVDHTTCFAKPRTLDAKSISTQTVTSIDPPDKPYAVFTFLYRGEKQLQKMGFLRDPAEDMKPNTQASKRRSTQIDFSSLKPLDSATGTKGFAGYRDEAMSRAERRRAFGKDVGDDGDSDADEEEGENQMKDAADEHEDKRPEILSPQEAARQDEAVEGIRTMKLKRQHSAELLADEPAALKQPASKSPSTAASSSPVLGSDTPRNGNASSSAPSSASLLNPLGLPNSSTEIMADNRIDNNAIPSPFKKQRASLSCGNGSVMEPPKGLNALLAGARSLELAGKEKEESEIAKAMAEKAFGGWGAPRGRHEDL